MVEKVPCRSLIRLVGVAEEGIVAHIRGRVLCEREMLEKGAKVVVFGPSLWICAADAKGAAYMIEDIREGDAVDELDFGHAI